MIRMSKVIVPYYKIHNKSIHFIFQDFATSSLKSKVAAENEEVIDEEQIKEYQIDERKQWEQK